MIYEVFNQNSKYYRQMMDIIVVAKVNPPEEGQVHHIVPRCWFKHFHQEVDNSISNTVLLSYEDHKLVHQLAYKCAKEPWFYNKMRHASTFHFGESPMTGHKHTDETKEKLRESHKGKKQSEETKRKIGESNKGKHYYWKNKHLTEETKKKMSKSRKGKNTWMKGRKLSEETRRKISESLKGHKRSPETVEKIRLSNLGQKRSEETKRKMREAHMKNSNK